MQLKANLSSGARPVASRVAFAQPKRNVRAAGSGGSDSPATAPVDFEELSDIIKLVNNTDIVELELKSKKFNLTVRKKEALQAAEPVIQMMSAPQMPYTPAPMQAPAPAPATAPPPPSVAPAPRPAAPAAAPPAAAAGGQEMLSPMGGTFYRSPAPGEPPFIKEGDRIKKGQVVGVIEAMKLMNEVEAEMSGEVVKCLVENGKPITTGQALFVIKP